MSARILVPLDGSELAEAALPYAEQLGKALGWGIVLYSVVPDEEDRPPYVPSTPVVEAGPDVWERYEGVLAQEDRELQHEEIAALDAMAPAASRLQAAGLHVERETGVGKPQNIIARRAAADDVGLIVLASHGRTGLARVFRGSVAAGVVGHTRRPTVVVRPFRDAEHRLDLEHGDHLPAEQAEIVRKVLSTPAGGA